MEGWLSELAGLPCSCFIVSVVVSACLYIMGLVGCVFESGEKQEIKYIVSLPQSKLMKL